MNIAVTHIAAQVISQAGASGAPGAGPVDQLLSIVPLLLILLVMYFLLIRPAKKQQEDHRKLLNQLKKDDRVLTSGGFCVKIVSVEDKTAVVELVDKVKVRILKERISGLWDEETGKNNS